ncbi:ankyrin-1-like, partial [Pseudomyrmex gracilis]|uniref:ankyrin-1-like n=1 Tax=Pseudomyrmex gracilis TaxID=219809 RepID=UPI0009954DA0
MGYIATNYRLRRAVREGNLERARKLLTYLGLSYSQIWSEGYVLLRDAIWNRHTEVIKLLLTSGCKVNNYTKKSYNTPLHFAVINGDIEIVKMLLDRSANINIGNQFGRTPLHNAMENKKIEIAELLLDYGATVNASDSFGVTPLCLAVRQRHVDGVKMLLDRSANVNTQTQWSGTTPLHDAMENKQIEIAELLLNHGANI